MPILKLLVVYVVSTIYIYILKFYFSLGEDVLFDKHMCKWSTTSVMSVNLAMLQLIAGARRYTRDKKIKRIHIYCHSKPVIHCHSWCDLLGLLQLFHHLPRNNSKPLPLVNLGEMMLFDA